MGRLGLLIFVITAIISYFRYGEKGPTEENRDKYTDYVNAAIVLSVVLMGIGLYNTFKTTPEEKKAREESIAIEESESIAESESLDEARAERESIKEEEKRKEEEEEKRKEQEIQDAINANPFDGYALKIWGSHYRPNESQVDGEAIKIVIDMPDAFRTAGMSPRFEKGVTEYLEEIKDEHFISIEVEGMLDVQDSYGVEKEEPGYTLYFKKETVDKINFDNFRSENLSDIADDMFWHYLLR